MKKILILLFIVFVVSSSTVFCQEIRLYNQDYEPALSEPEYVDLHESNIAGYYKYINDRYAFSVIIPEKFSLAYLSQNNDGAIFYLPDKSAGIRISGMHNIGLSIDDYYGIDVKSVGSSNIEFENHGSNWYVISWIEDGNIYYQKTFVSGQYQNTLVVFYPAEKKENFDKIISTIEANFVPGWLTGYKIWG